ncbi:hypothetical protein E2C01_025673 [Portunus trituberculatus]|uniref:Uncharacterized protein n=1 Tax=Portunus trituberculatus TaxID=210409 RepID=A0A5B7EH33_PORTR|nr:hypothetical protein [Portunus trituberculatus]
MRLDSPFAVLRGGMGGGLREVDEAGESDDGSGSVLLSPFNVKREASWVMRVLRVWFSSSRPCTRFCKMRSCRRISTSLPDVSTKRRRKTFENPVKSPLWPLKTAVKKEQTPLPHLCLGFVYGDSIDRHCQLNLGRLASLSLLQLLVKLELPDPLLHHLNAFGLVDLCAAQELRKHLANILPVTELTS